MIRRKLSVLLSLLSAMAVLSLGVPLAHAGAGVAASTDINGNPIQFPPISPTAPRESRRTGPETCTIPATALRKFVDSLPLAWVRAGANNLGQYIPVAAPDISTYPGSDYYVIAILEFEEQMHSDLPKPTSVRAYVQLETPANAASSAHSPSSTPTAPPSSTPTATRSTPTHRRTTWGR